MSRWESLFWERVHKTKTCWLWTGRLDENGYGLCKFTGTRRAHQSAYRLLVGTVPDGLTLDHLCRVRHCVNPDHLEAVTQSVNNLRGFGFSGRNARKSHCDSGHEFSHANTYIRPGGHRGCRLCNAAAVRRYQSRQAA